MEQSSRNRASLAAFLSGLRVVGAGFGFLTYLILAKFLSPDGLGEVFAAFSLAAVGGTVASLGYAQIAVRFAARYRNKGKPGWFRGFVDQSTRQVVLVAIGLGVLIGAVLLLGVVSDAQSARFYLLACVAIPPIAVMNLYVGHAIGLRLFITSYLPEGFGRPLALLILIALTIVSGVSLTGSIVLWAFAMSSARFASTS